MSSYQLIFVLKKTEIKSKSFAPPRFWSVYPANILFWRGGGLWMAVKWRNWRWYRSHGNDNMINVVLLDQTLWITLLFLFNGSGLNYIHVTHNHTRIQKKYTHKECTAILFLWESHWIIYSTVGLARLIHLGIKEVLFVCWMSHYNLFIKKTLIHWTKQTK